VGDFGFDLEHGTRLWRTTVEWLDANHVGMTFTFLFTFLATLRRRSRSRWLNTVYGAMAGVPLALIFVFAPAVRGIRTIQCCRAPIEVLVPET
jgi:hypothetical protein